MDRRIVKAVALIVIIAMVVTSLSFIVFLPAAFGAEQEIFAATSAQEQRYLNEKLRDFEIYLKYIHDNYKDDVDYEVLVNGAFEGAMYSLGDPYSVYFWDPEEGQAFVESAEGEYEGIGIGLTTNADSLCEITSVMPKSPADKAGIKKGDVIVKIDGKDVTKKSVQEIGNLLKGPAGTTVTVTIKRAGADTTLKMTREKIQSASVFYEMLEGDIGYIALTGFTTSGTSEFMKAKNALTSEGAKSLIIDLRDNPGGLINTAVDIAEMFIEKGDIFHCAQRGNIFETVHATNKTIKKMPLVMLVNEYSASASELLAGALKDNKAAELVGVTTYGKGVAQGMGYINGHPFKLSEFYFLTPDKHEIQEVGVTPDYVVRNSLGAYSAEAMKTYQTFAPFAENTKPKAGDTGLNVFAAQQRLALLGYEVYPTATMDAATVAAVKKFQTEEGIYAYGVLDATTIEKLDSTAFAYASNTSKEDLQLKKAIELLKK